MQLTDDQINYLNVGLMILACCLAYRFPFELFLFSYAVMGPLHYLTEISWHVMLEFPLNHRTFAGIGREIYALAR